MNQRVLCMVVGCVLLGCRSSAAPQTDAAPPQKLLGRAEFIGRFPEVARPTYALVATKEVYERLKKSSCATDFSRRRGISLKEIAATLAVHLRVKKQYARLEKLALISGDGDEELVECYRRFGGWPANRYPVPSAADGVYSFIWPIRLPVEAVNQFRSP
jgi:hypothetical protein